MGPKGELAGLALRQALRKERQGAGTAHQLGVGHAQRSTFLRHGAQTTRAAVRPPRSHGIVAKARPVMEPAARLRNGGRSFHPAPWPFAMNDKMNRRDSVKGKGSKKEASRMERPYDRRMRIDNN